MTGGDPAKALFAGEGDGGTIRGLKHALFDPDAADMGRTFAEDHHEKKLGIYALARSTPR